MFAASASVAPAGEAGRRVKGVKQMTHDEKSMTTPNLDETEEIYLPINRKDLGRFITGLLGQPQTLEKSTPLFFDINHEWLIDLHHSLDQRIKQQAHADLVEFNAIILLENKLKRTLNSVSAFETYRETKNLKSIGVKLMWTYLVSFPGKELPEKQKIFFQAITPQDENSGGDTIYSEFRTVINKYILTTSTKGEIKYIIENTERTWGDDIESLITDRINGIVRDKSKLHDMFQVLKLLLVLLIITSGLAAPEIIDSYIIDKKISDLYSVIGSAKDALKPSIDELNKKIDLLLTLQNAGTSLGIGQVKKLLVFIVAAFIATLTLFFSTYTMNSFVVLTTQASDSRDKLLLRERNKKAILFGSFFAAFCASILANYIYYLLS